jgi:Tfp pilus assembly protein PilF
MLRKMESVAEAEPRSATLMEIAGRLYADRGWYRDARRCLERALQIDPGRASAAHVLARTFAASGQMSAAVNSAAEMGGESAALVDGLRAQERNDLTSAARYYENALRLGEHSGVAANNLAWIYAQQGTELDRALELAKDAAELVPHNPAVLDTLGLVYLRRREYSQAINTLEAARRIATAHPQPAAEQSIRQNLAEAYIRAGQTSAAAELINNLPGSAFHR